MSESVYVVIEGIDGAGKTLSSKTLYKTICEATGESPVELTEPQKLHGTVGAEIRTRLTEGPELAAWEAVGLFTADRIQLARTILTPTLKSGRIVIQDRNWLSTCVFNGCWGNPDYDQPARPFGQWLAGFYARTMPLPDLVILLDLDRKTAETRLAARAKETGRKLDQFDRDGKHEERRKRYLDLVKAGHGKWWIKDVTIDASKSEKTVAAAVWKAVKPVLKAKGRKVKMRESSRA